MLFSGRRDSGSSVGRRMIELIYRALHRASRRQRACSARLLTATLPSVLSILPMIINKDTFCFGMSCQRSNRLISISSCLHVLRLT